MDGAGSGCGARAPRLPPILRSPRLPRVLPEHPGGRAALDGGRGRPRPGLDAGRVERHAARPPRAPDGEGDTMRSASAPVSFGVFEMTAADTGLPDPDRVLDAMAAAGYQGTELGPPGYFGDGAGAAGALEQRGLALAGSFLPLRLSRSERAAEDTVYLDE